MIVVEPLIVCVSVPTVSPNVVFPFTVRVPPILLLPVALNVPVTSNAQAGVA